MSVFKYFKYAIEILKLSTHPMNFIYPIPILAVLVYSMANRDIQSLITAIAFTYTFYPAVNLWNHVNDVEEDKHSGRTNILTENSAVRKATIVLVLTLYAISALIAYIKSSRYFPLFLICFFLTWAYSDRMIIGRVAFRLKDHYATEIMAFTLSYISFTLLLWSFFENINLKAIALTTTITLLMLSGTVLKDIKDVTGDERAGLKTLAVVFSLKTLLKASIVFQWLYYLSIALPVFFKIYSPHNIVALIPSVLLLYATIELSRNSWKLTFEVYNAIKAMVLSSITSLILLTVSSLI